jgi:hypothetical protein
LPASTIGFTESLNTPLVGLVAVVAPVLIFGLAEHVTRVGEGRHPFAADQPVFQPT